VQEAVCAENAKLMEAMSAIRKEFGDDAVEGALMMDDGIVVYQSLNFSLALDPDNVDSASLKLVLDLSCLTKQAENEARMQDALRQKCDDVPPDLNEWMFIAIARIVDAEQSRITVIFMTGREHARNEAFTKVGATRLRNAKPGRPAWTKETIDRFLTEEFPPPGEGASFEITWVPEDLSAEDQITWLVSHGEISMHEIGHA
jgi:hypothetical protein